ncbi:MAG: hypothetical protein ONB31_14985 [candidate division KSB1 bacterium]|nr:hypothetical protein [candidate division KSB1 bacterium]MDZ7336541.1 hypothetical protein [candidate division KSB1 bacterium]MDZ7358753.1 hypothetical protein [candidate division KSB1 bacterium]MDZ7402260.1 hypothetical protein [candidate division KSB1 bacterium]
MGSPHQKPVIFLAFANPRDDSVPYLRNLPDEQRQIRDALDLARSAGLCEIVERSNVRTQDIWDVFQHPDYRDRIAIFHFGGHANSYQLLLENAAGESSPTFASGLAEFLGQQRGLQFVFLNGCSTQPQAMGLLHNNVSVVIATSQTIIDQLATRFAARFYAGLSGGASIRIAFNEAAASIKAELGEDLAQYYRDCGLEADRWPWDIYVRAGADVTDNWNLPDAADDPLFGLPKIPPAELPKVPFCTLHWFDRDHAEVFFGREYQIRELYQRILSPHALPIQLIYGQCGVGKSSFLAAGLLSRLASAAEVRYYRCKRELNPLNNLKQAFAPHDPNEWRAIEQKFNKPLVILMDQFERTFDRANSNELEQFFDQLYWLFIKHNQSLRGKLVLVFRKEWLAEIEKRFKEHKLPIELMFLERLDRRGIISAITGLTRNKRLQEYYGLTIEPGLEEIIADDLMEDVGSPLAPTLQILLSKMWLRARRRNPKHPYFSIKMYQDMKKQGILLKDFYYQQMEKLRRWSPEVVDSGLALDVLSYHCGALGTAEQRTKAQLRNRYCHRMDVIPSLIRKLKNLYLLADPSKSRTARRRSGVTRLAHDTLAPIVREHYEESYYPGQRASRILASKMTDFHEGRDIWLDEADLAVVETGLSGMRSLTSEEQQLIRISQQRRARHQKRRRMMLSSGIIAILVIICSAIISIYNMHQAQLQERAAKVNYLSILANDVSKINPHKALRVAEAAFHLSRPTPPLHLRQLMYRLFWQSPEEAWFDRGFSHNHLVSSVAFSPDGNMVLTGSWDRTAKLWTTEGRLIHVFRRPAPITSAKFSSDGRKIGLGLANGQAEVWTETGDSLGSFRHRSQVNSVAFSPDGKKLLTASSDSSARLWSLDGTVLTTFRHGDQVISAVFASNGAWVLTASFDRTARFWTSMGSLETTFQHDDRVYSAQFSPDGKKILTASRDKTAKLWSLNGDLLATLPSESPVLVAIFHPNNDQIFTVADDHRAKLWTIDGDSIGGSYYRYKIYSAAFSPDGKTILVASSDQQARIWLTPEGIYDWLKSSPIPELSKQEKTQYHIE